MSDLEKSVAIIVDWKKDHQEEHKDVWGKFKMLDERHIDLVKAIAEMKTQISVYAGIATLLGTLAGQFLVRLILR